VVARRGVRFLVLGCDCVFDFPPQFADSASQTGRDVAVPAVSCEREPRCCVANIDCALRPRKDQVEEGAKRGVCFHASLQTEERESESLPCLGAYRVVVELAIQLEGSSKGISCLLELVLMKFQEAKIQGAVHLVCPVSDLLRLRLLQDEGLLGLRRRRGITVTGTPERGAVMQKVHELVEFARGQGYAADELVQMINDVA
jgi:hypothetical protein